MATESLIFLGGFVALVIAIVVSILLYFYCKTRDYKKIQSPTFELGSTEPQESRVTATKSQNESITKQNSKSARIKTKSSAALEALKDMVEGVKNAEKKTAAYFRFCHDETIIEALEDFCKEEEEDEEDEEEEEEEEEKEDKKMKDDEETINHLTKRTLELFDRLNTTMVDQERAVHFIPHQKSICMKSSGRDFCRVGHMSMARSSTELIDFSKSILEDREIVAIVFGGKEAHPVQSLSENLVNTLSEACLHVYTVSRSNMEPEKKNITHFSNKNLCDESEEGEQGFVDVIKACITEHFPPKLRDEKRKKKVLVMYFTMGYHKGHDAYNTNLRSANNFANALLKTLPSASNITSNSKNGATNTKSCRGDFKWKVIVTGTDATRPSTQKDITAEWERTSTTPPSDHPGNTVDPENFQSETSLSETSLWGTEEPIQLTIPSYKIGKWNYVYAMSKLGQFYIIADAIATLTIPKDIYEEEQKNKEVNVSEIVKKITRHVKGAGDKFMYDEDITNIITMDELNKISSNWTDVVQPFVTTHLAEATGLSILYTTLHCRSWVIQAVKNSKEDKVKYDGSVRANIVFEIVKRLPNAISIEMGTRLHTRHGYVEQRNDEVIEPMDTMIIHKQQM